MTRLLSGLIQPMNFIVIKDYLYTLFIDERDNQNALAALPPYSMPEDEIEQYINFEVYKNTFSVKDAEKIPCIMINSDDINFSGEGSYGSVGKYKENIQYKFACFASGVSTPAGQGDPAYTADQNAEMRLSYLVSQALGILGSSINWTKQASNLVEVPTLSSIQRIETSDSKNESEVILGCEILLNLRTTEFFEPAPTVPLAEIYGTLQIKDGVVAPFFRYFFNQ